LVVVDQRARDSVTDRAGLARGAASADRDVDVGLVDGLGHRERLADDHSRRLAAEEYVERAAVDDDLARAGLDEHARRGGLAAAGAVIAFSGHFSIAPAVSAAARRAGARCHARP